MITTTKLIVNLLLFSAFCLLSTNSIFAQSEKKADMALSNSAYQKAYAMYKELVEMEKEEEVNIDLWYKYAEVARQLNDLSTAEKYYTRIMESGETPYFSMCALWLGYVKKSLGKYEEAIELFNVFIYQNQNQSYAESALQEIQSCLWAMSSTTEPKNLRMDRLDDQINSDYSEMAAVEMGNHLYYTTFRYKYTEDKEEPKRHLAKMMLSKNLEKGRPVPSPALSSDQHVAHTAFSADWQRMYFTLCEFVDESERMTCQIYYSDQDENGRWDRNPTPLPDFINLPGFTATHPAIGFDSAIQKEVLYFVSDRPDGMGQLDIWASVVEKNNFFPPLNLSAINSASDDVTPFFHTPTQTLFFSSTANTGFGGFDIFSTKPENSNWTAPENIGSPFNSSYDDLFFSKNTNGNRAYLSTNRPGTQYPRGQYEGCCFDIYRIYLDQRPGTLNTSRPRH